MSNIGYMENDKTGQICRGSFQREGWSPYKPDKAIWEKKGSQTKITKVTTYGKRSKLGTAVQKIKQQVKKMVTAKKESKVANDK